MPPVTQPPYELPEIEQTGNSQVWLWIVIVVGVLISIGILILVGRFVYRTVVAFLANRMDQVPLSDSLPAGARMAGVALTSQEVGDAVDEALRRLDQAPTATDAVIMAWLVFEEAASRHGMHRDPAQTPTEFTTALLDDSAVPPADTVTLRTLYLRTRFSDLPATAGDVNQARLCLERIARSLEARV